MIFLQSSTDQHDAAAFHEHHSQTMTDLSLEIVDLHFHYDVALHAPRARDHRVSDPVLHVIDRYAHDRHVPRGHVLVSHVLHFVDFHGHLAFSFLFSYQTCQDVAVDEI